MRARERAKSTVIKTMAAKMTRSREFTVADAKVISALVNDLIRAGENTKQRSTPKGKR